MKIPLVDALIDWVGFFEEPTNHPKVATILIGFWSAYAVFVTTIGTYRCLIGVQHRFLPKPFDALLILAGWFITIFMVRLTERIIREEVLTH